MALLLWASLGALGLALWKLIPALLRPFRSPVRSLPGPPSPSWLWGQSKKIFAAENSVLHQEWIEKYGNVLTYTGFLNINRLYTHDMRALNHVLTHSADFQKPEETRTFLTRLLGAGVLVTEGDQHRQQRRVMNPAFGPAQIRGLTPIFNDISIKLRDMWAAEIAETGTGFKKIDALSWLSRATLDIIGQAGFNYYFNNLEGGQSELNDAFNTVFTPDQNFNLFRILRQTLPIVRSISNKRMQQMDAAQGVMRRIGLQLIADKKAAILSEKAQQGGGVEKRDLEGRDLLTLLLKANMATDIPESQRLSDEDVLAQVPTFLLAGHETTSTGTTWCLYALTQAPEVQRKLREELLSVSTDTPTMDELMALPYLDMVVKEVLRLHAPVPSTVRIATKEEVIPVSEPFTDRFGEVQDKIRVAKGDYIFIPILAINRDKAIWGEDSMEFRPERWEKESDAASSIPGVWGHLMTFIGGPRACIGYRFSVVEMKALIFALVRAFEFELAVPVEDLIKKTGIVQRPLVRTEMDKGTQMPLIVKAYHHQ